VLLFYIIARKGASTIVCLGVMYLWFAFLGAFTGEVYVQWLCNAVSNQCGREFVKCGYFKAFYSVKEAKIGEGGVNSFEYWISWFRINKWVFLFFGGCIALSVIPFVLPH
jgi:hypothetical protein